ncbi:MAG: DUF1905 domain-containing protein [Candidatus Doudnabacteria bacterium]
MLTTYETNGKIIEYPGMGSWHFIAVPEKESASIKATFGDMKRGFGSLRVIASVGKTKWKTSIFPDTKTATYLLPLKSDVRKRERVKAGDTIQFSIEILV